MLIRLLRPHLRPYRRAIAMLIALQLGQTTAMLYLPTLSADVIDNGVVTGDSGYVLRLGAVMLAVAVLQVIGGGGAVYFGVRTAMAVGRDIRTSIFQQVQSLSTREVGDLGAASLVTRTTNDVQQVQMLLLMTFTRIVVAPIMCVGGIVMAMRQDVSLSVLLLVLVPILAVLVSLVIRRMQPLFRVMQARTDTVNQTLREQIGGVRTIRAFVRDKYEQQRFTKANTELTDAALRSGRLFAMMLPLAVTMVHISIVPMLWFGAYRIDRSDLQIGALIAFLGYLMLILASVNMAAIVFTLVPRASVGAERIQEVLRTESSLTIPPEPVRHPRRHGQLELRGVHFRYPGAETPVLRGVDLIAQPGETTAVIGSTGSGKSTLLGLIARLFDATGGQVLVAGEEVRDLDPATLAELVGLVPQRAYLFSGTVASNLRYGRPEAIDAELWRQLEIAQARDFVERLEGGLQAPVAQGGTNFSGGQRQRLAIARVLVRRPEIYLFDDSFSSLDHAVEARLRAALATELAGATKVIVAQRVAVVRDAARIVVLDSGQVAGTGTHRELLAQNPIYREIAASQGIEEAAAV
jgi:ATP-binding cassette subfamily B protein